MRAERDRAEENLPSEFPANFPDLEEAYGLPISETCGTADFPNLLRCLLLAIILPLEMHESVTDSAMTVLVCCWWKHGGHSDLQGWLPKVFV